MSIDAKLELLLNKLIEQQLDEAELVELSALLRTDPQAVEAHLALLGIHMGMAQLVAPVREFSAEELRAVSEVDHKLGKFFGPEPAELADSSNDRVATPAPRKTIWDGALRLGVLAAAAIAAIVVFALWLRTDDSSPSGLAQNDPVTPVDGVGDPDDNVVARVIKKVDCDWEDDRWSVSTSASILAGQQISLSRGILVLKFGSGPEVTLNGPATFVAKSDTSAQLVDGTLSARVPPEGRGFRIETHAGDFIDLGTEFGMIVTKEGAVETHVFKGQVIAEPVLAGAEQTDSIVLDGGVTWARLAHGDSKVSNNAQSNRFMRPVVDDVRAKLAAPPVTTGLKLWFEASQLAERDERDGVYAWGNQITIGQEKTLDAWQVMGSKRPQWRPNAMGERPALHFDGSQGLTTEPMILGPAHTSAVVFRIDPEAASRNIRKRKEFQHLGVQLLNLNGPPHTVLQVNDDLHIEARVHLGFLKDQRDPVDVGLIRTDKPVTENVHVVLYSYDGRESAARLVLDGRTIAESTDAPLVQSTNAPRFLGSHYDREGFGFTGDIAEILVFDAGLSADESLLISRWLAEKYDIRSTPDDAPFDSSIGE
jgi:hypothetical protein